MQRQTGFNIVYALTIYINLKYQNYIPNVCGCTYCKNSMLDAWEGLKCDFDEIRYGVIQKQLLEVFYEKRCT